MLSQPTPENLADVTSDPSQSLFDRFIVFAQTAQEERYQARIKTLSAVIWNQFLANHLVPVGSKDAAYELLGKGVLSDPSFFQQSIEKVVESINAWFTRPEGLPPLIADLVAFLNVKE